MVNIRASVSNIIEKKHEEISESQQYKEKHGYQKNLYMKNFLSELLSTH
jgi:hypothetical protein